MAQPCPRGTESDQEVRKCHQRQGLLLPFLPPNPCAGDILKWGQARGPEDRHPPAGQSGGRSLSRKPGWDAVSAGLRLLASLLPWTPGSLPGAQPASPPCPEGCVQPFGAALSSPLDAERPDTRNQSPWVSGPAGTVAGAWDINSAGPGRGEHVNL